MDAVARQQALDQARQGDRQALGDLLESFRPYLAAQAVTLRAGRWGEHFGDSDIVQDALVTALARFETFRGATVAELAAWLQQIVTRIALHKIRELGREKRDIERERRIDDLGLLAGNGSSPSACAIGHEQAAAMAAAVARLPDDMKQVVLGRHQEELPHAVIAQRLGRTEGAVRVLYVRALRRLRQDLPNLESSSWR